MKRVCVDGPVFDSRAVFSWLLARARASPTALHHQFHPAQDTDVRGRIALHGHEVSQQPGTNRADLCRRCGSALAFTDVAAASTSSAGMPSSCMSSISRTFSPCANTPNVTARAQDHFGGACGCEALCAPARGPRAVVAGRSSRGNARIASPAASVGHSTTPRFRHLAENVRPCHRSRARWCPRPQRWRGACPPPCWRAPRLTDGIVRGRNGSAQLGLRECRGALLARPPTVIRVQLDEVRAARRSAGAPRAPPPSPLASSAPWGTSTPGSNPFGP